mmetsp:Transcript_43872/g.113303  ORF Transcript_43872/g.113303 Transcript_43872/m.113303 type:complete len:224 (+) Transcript_43872:823-1494(+)
MAVLPPLDWASASLLGALPEDREGLDGHRVEDAEHVRPLRTAQPSQGTESEVEGVPAHADGQDNDAKNHRSTQRELAPADARVAKLGLPPHVPQHSVGLRVQGGLDDKDDGPHHTENAGEEHHDPGHLHRGYKAGEQGERVQHDHERDRPADVPHRQDHRPQHAVPPPQVPEPPKTLDAEEPLPQPWRLVTHVRQREDPWPQRLLQQSHVMNDNGKAQERRED